MGYEVTLRQVAPQSVTVCRFTSAWDRASDQMGVALDAVLKYLGQVGAHPTGPAFSRWFVDEDSEAVLVKAGYPVSREVPGQDCVEPDHLPGGLVAVTRHVGPYDTLGEAYDAMKAWITGRGRDCTGEPWEVYVVGSDDEADPANWKTEIYWPLV